MESHNPELKDKSRDKRKKLSFTELHLFADTFQFIANNILKIDSLSTLTKKIKLHPQKDPEVEEKMDDWFRSYLYEKKVISK